MNEKGRRKGTYPLRVYYSPFDNIEEVLLLSGLFLPMPRRPRKAYGAL